MIEPALTRWIALAEVARPHGVRGELRLRVFNQESDLLLDVERVLLRTKDGDKPMIVDFARRTNDAILMKLRGIDDRDRAAALRGAEVCVKRADFPPLEAGEFYACDIEDARVLLGAEDIGRVRELRTYPSVDVLYVEGHKKWEVPLTSEFIERVDPENKLVVLRTLESLEPL